MFASLRGYEHSRHGLRRMREALSRVWPRNCSSPLLPFFVGEVARYRDAVWLEPLFALHQHTKQYEDDAFDKFGLGLDHITFGCSSRDELEGWPGRLDALGIDHGAIVDAPYGSGLAFRDPDNIQIEFFLPPDCEHTGRVNHILLPLSLTDKESVDAN